MEIGSKEWIEWNKKLALYYKLKEKGLTMDTSKTYNTDSKKPLVDEFNPREFLRSDTSKDIRERLAKKLWDIEHPQDKAVLRVEFEEYPKSVDFIQDHYKKVDSILQVFKEYIEEKREKAKKYPMILPNNEVCTHREDKYWNDGYDYALGTLLEGLEKEGK